MELLIILAHPAAFDKAKGAGCPKEAQDLIKKIELRCSGRLFYDRMFTKALRQGNPLLRQVSNEDEGMSEKTEQKRQKIVSAARSIFAQKGYKNVTMKDIVEACQISRGGLYLYFGSVREVFEAVLSADEAEADDVFARALRADATIADVLMIFLKEQKKEILEKKDDLAVATYEYHFANALSAQENPHRNKFEDALKALTRLLEAGMENGEFYEMDARAAAGNIMYALEGLRICARTMNLTEEMVDEEMFALASSIVAE